jgi:hypothetical protein
MEFPRMSIGRDAVCLLVAVAGVVLVAGRAAAQPIVVEEIVRSTPGGVVRGYFATVDLQDPRVEIVTTGVNTANCAGSPTNAALTTTTSFRSTNTLALAVNANFFSTCNSTRGDTIGLLVSNGTVVSPARQYLTNAPDPALMFTADKLASIGNLATATPGVFDAVAGIGPSNTDSVPGTLLVTEGVNTGATARVTPLTREPRTGAGVSRDGRWLYLAVIDGRQTGWSVGMTLPELADLFIQKGAFNALNLDGGGSSCIAFQRPDGSVATNRPSDGSPRPVSANLGVRVTSLANTDRITRPIRGAWVRPHGSGTAYPNTFQATTYENTVRTIAEAGIQDLFLETLFWGRDTGQNGNPNFPARFSSDALAEAIRIAARYSVRVHAWCETGYLDFGTSPSPLLAANPSWVVRNLAVARGSGACPAPNTLTGDLANQRFVNLGNPGVRAALNGYFAQLRANYPGLEGVQADYHFFPIGNPPANANDIAMWSYDDWAIANFRDASGNLVNPLLSATNCTGGVTYNSSTWVVTGGAHPNWINWNRRNVTDALVLIRAAADGVESGGSGVFSAVSFGNWSSPIHLSKMIDLPGWGTNYGADAFFIMAYGTSTTSINTELQNAQTALPGRRVVAGLANLVGAGGTYSRPSIAAQLATMQGRGIQDFSIFEANTLVSNAATGIGSATQQRTDLRTWIDVNATPQIGDIDRDGYVDARDVALFDATFSGASLPASTLPRADLNADGSITGADRRFLIAQFNRSKFGEDGIVDLRDLAALRACFGQTPGSTMLHLWDLNADNVVDWRDELIGIDALTIARSPDTDVNDDGVTNLEDIYRWLASPSDAGDDGATTPADLALVIRDARGGEAADKTDDRR